MFDIHSASAQEVFDFVLGKLREQKVQARNVYNTVCAYRGAGGCKCAVGWLIPDEVYSEQMEGNRVGALALEGGFEEHMDLLIQLQYAHDAMTP